MNKRLISIIGAATMMAAVAVPAFALVRIQVENNAEVDNKAEAEANTGRNDQIRLTECSFDTLQNGRNDILTGDASAEAGALAVTNKTEMDIRNQIVANRRGCDCENKAPEDCLCSSVEVSVRNLRADVDNEADADADTGKNDQEMIMTEDEVTDQNGENIITTGDAEASSVADAYTNTQDLKVDAGTYRPIRAARE